MTYAEYIGSEIKAVIARKGYIRFNDINGIVNKACTLYNISEAKAQTIVNEWINDPEYRDYVQG